MIRRSYPQLVVCVSLIVIVSFFLATSCRPVSGHPFEAPGVKLIKTNGIAVVYAVLSPDMSSFVLISADGRLGQGPRNNVHLLDQSLGTSVSLTGARSAKFFNLQDPAISPDSHRVAFVGESDTLQAGIFVIDTQTNELKRVLGANYAAWSADWNEVALWNANECSGPISIHTSFCIMNLGTGHYTTIFSTSLPILFGGMDWSHDGQYLAVSFQEQPDVTVPAGSRIQVFDLNSGRHWPITPEAVTANSPSWSPEGRLLAYIQASPKRSADRIVVSTLDGQCSTELLATPGMLTSVNWSKGGNSIAFVLDNNLYTIDLNHPEIKHALETLTCGKNTTQATIWLKL